MRKSNQNSRLSRNDSAFYTLLSSFCFVILFSIFYFLFSIAPADAAKLYFDPPSGEFSSEAVLPISVFLDTEGEEINAIEAVVEFPPDVFAVSGTSDGNSVVSFWVGKPEISAGRVSFSGIIPGGYNGKKALLMKIFLLPKKSGPADMIFGKNSASMLDDGEGTKAELKLLGAEYRLSKKGSVLAEPEDDTPPETFKPEIGQSDDLFGGKYFLVFSAADKGSGIGHYEVKEGDGPYKTAESGYILENQKIDEDITVRAVDRSGNSREAVIPRGNRFPLYQELLITVIIILICVLALRFLSKIRS